MTIHEDSGDEVILDKNGNPLSKREEDIARKDFDDWKEKDPKKNNLKFKNYLEKIWFTDATLVQSKETLIENDSNLLRIGFSILMVKHVKWTIKLLTVLKQEQQRTNAIEKLLKNKIKWVRLLGTYGIDQSKIDEWYKPPVAIDVENNQLGEGIFLEHSLAALGVFDNAAVTEDDQHLLIAQEGKETSYEEAWNTLTKTNKKKVVKFWTDILSDLKIEGNFENAWTDHLVCTAKYARQFLIAGGNKTDPNFVKEKNSCLQQGSEVGQMIDMALMPYFYPPYGPYPYPYSNSKDNIDSSITHNESIEGGFLTRPWIAYDKKKTIKWFLQNNQSTSTDWAWKFFSVSKDILDTLDEEFSDKKFTLFLPTQEAFRKFLLDNGKMLSTETFEMRKIVTKILKTHILLERINIKKIDIRKKTITMGDNKIWISKEQINVFPGAKIGFILSKGISASNGIIYFINRVIFTTDAETEFKNISIMNRITTIQSKQSEYLDDLSNIPILESKRKNLDLSNVPILESKRLSECECDSSSHDVLESQREKVPQNQHEVVIPETLESKRHLMKKNNVKQQIISTTNSSTNITSQQQLAPKNRLHLSHMDQIYMDNDSLTISNQHQLNGIKKKSIGIREESNLLFAFKKLSKYVDHKDEFSKTLNDSEHAKDLVNELQKIVDSIDKHRLEEKPAEHLKSTNALYSILDYEKISKMNKSKIVDFIAAINSLSNTLQEHKYDKCILKIINK